MTPTEALAHLKLTVHAEFVPFSLSRNNGKTKGRPEWKSLNWNVTLQRAGVAMLATEYSAGVGHCPGNKKPAPTGWDRPDRFWKEAVADWEIENGFQASWTHWSGFKAARRPATQEERDEGKRAEVRIAILPKPEDVVYSLLTEADTLDFADFEQWADNYGYDTDSRKAESLYRDSLATALKLRAALGEEGLAILRAAFEDY